MDLCSTPNNLNPPYLAWLAGQALAESSKGCLPALPDEPIYVSASCTHTNLWLRCLQAATCKTHHPKLRDPNGNIDRDRLLRDQPDLEEATRLGLHWTVIKSEVLVVFPSLASFAQRALNFEARQHVGETEVIKQAWL